jgi:hypothetical protein
LGIQFGYGVHLPRITLRASIGRLRIIKFVSHLFYRFMSSSVVGARLLSLVIIRFLIAGLTTGDRILKTAKGHRVQRKSDLIPHPVRNQCLPNRVPLLLNELRGPDKPQIRGMILVVTLFPAHSYVSAWQCSSLLFGSGTIN